MCECVNVGMVGQECVSYLMQLNLDDMKEGVEGLRVAYMTPGDCLFIPFNTVVCDKAVGGQVSGIRVNGCVYGTDMDLNTSFQHMFRMYPESLGLGQDNNFTHCIL